MNDLRRPESLLPLADPVVRWQLHLVRSRGAPKHGVLPVPVTGGGLAAALELAGERLNDTQWRAANLCRIGQVGNVWHLLQGSPALVCALNGRRMPAGASAPIAAGDIIQLGLQIFEVAQSTDRVAVPPTSSSFAAAPSPVAKSASALAQVAPGEGDAFDLRDLARPGPISKRDAPATDVLPNDLFSVLDIAGAEAQPMSDPLAELLGEAPVPSPTPTARRTDRLNTASALRASAEQGHGTAVAQRASTRAPLPAGNKPQTDSASALLDGLHDEFVRVVCDSTQLSGRADWEGLLAVEGEPAPTLGELSQEARGHPLLRDIMLPRESIDQVIEEFQPLNPSGLLEMPESDEVLCLFAAELLRNARIAVPNLTRREHHVVSPDSHIDLGRAESGEQ